MELDLFSLEGAGPCNGFWYVSGLGMALGSLCVNVQNCVPDWHGVSCTEASWHLSGARVSVGMEACVTLSTTVAWGWEFLDGSLSWC